MISTQPLISIVTPCLNRASMIREAIESVINQNYENIEHIVVDGGSTDGTLDILNEYAQLYSHLKIVSEPDKNLYDGLNKGIKLAKGDIIGHLNTDDYYEENCFKEVIDAFQQHPSMDSVCGNAVVFETEPSANGNVEITKNIRIKSLFSHTKYKTLDLDNITYGMPIINARFFRKEVYEKVGMYNIHYPIAADRDFLLRCYIEGVITLCIDKSIYYYRHHEGSLTINSNKSNNTSKISSNDRITKEYLNLIKNYLNDSKTPSEVIRACYRWRTWILGYSMLQSAKANELKEAFQSLKEGFSLDPWFPFKYGWQRLRFKVPS